MTGVFTTIGNIVLMLVILGILVAIHEAGHLAAAKIFKVYCFEYSIGFGPAIFKKKRKKGETAFALRAFPLGGYVSMYGEPGVVPEGFEAPEDSRSLERIQINAKPFLGPFKPPQKVRKTAVFVLKTAVFVELVT